MCRSLVFGNLGDGLSDGKADIIEKGAFRGLHRFFWAEEKWRGVGREEGAVRVVSLGRSGLFLGGGFHRLLFL